MYNNILLTKKRRQIMDGVMIVHGQVESSAFQLTIIKQHTLFSYKNA